MINWLFHKRIKIAEKAVADYIEQCGYFDGCRYTFEGLVYVSQNSGEVKFTVNATPEIQAEFHAVNDKTKRLFREMKTAVDKCPKKYRNSKAFELYLHGYN